MIGNSGTNPRSLAARPSARARAFGETIGLAIEFRRFSGFGRKSALRRNQIGWFARRDILVELRGPTRVLAPPGNEDQAMTKLKTEDRNDLEKGAFAFPKERKEPLENASHVRNAIARFNQVEGVSDDERDAAWKRIEAAAKKFDVEVKEKSWREIGKG
jgi:hypothetical protein